MQQHAEYHSNIPHIADPDKTLSGGDKDTSKSFVAKADYGVISLFDGVSTVVPTLQKKLGYPPTVIVLAEIDISLRAVVCAEFGYRPDQTWGRTKNGSACLYNMLRMSIRYLTTVDAFTKPLPLRQMLSGSLLEDLPVRTLHLRELLRVCWDWLEQSTFLYLAWNNPRYAGLGNKTECSVSGRKCRLDG